MFRISVLATGDFFTMGNNTFPTDFTSWLFSGQDVLPGDKTFPTPLPLDERNRALIQNAHLINTARGLRRLQVMTWLGDIPFKQATLDFLIKNKSIDSTIKFNSSVIAPKLKLKLNELADPLRNDQLNFASMADFRDYMMSTITAVPGTVPMVFFPYKNELAYKEITDPAEQATYPDIAFPVNPFINAWQIVAGVGSFMVDTVPLTPESQTQTAFFTLPYVIRRALLFLGYQAQGAWLDEETSNRIVIGSNIAVQAPLIPDYYLLMPAVSLSDFFKILRTKLGLLFSFDQTNLVCRVDSLKNIRAFGPVLDLRDRQIANDYEETGANANAYSITQSVDDSDQAFTDEEKQAPPVLAIGDISGEVTVETVQLACVDTKMITEASPATVSSSLWRVPHIKMPIYPTTPFDQISDVKEADRHNFKFRLLYYHGMVEDAAGFPYPYGSSDNLDYNGTAISIFTLAMAVAANAFSNLKELYTYIRNSKPFMQGFKLRRQDLLQLAPNTRILCRDFDQSTVICLYDVASADLGKDEEILTRITLYPDIQPTNTLEISPADGAPVEPPVPGYDNGVVFVRLSERNFVNQSHPFPPPSYQTIDEDLYAEFFEDAAGLIPKDVIELEVRLKTTWYNPTGSPGIESIGGITCTSAGGESLLAANRPQMTSQGGVHRSWAYNIEPSAHYTVI